MKKKYLNIFFQVIALFFFIKVIFFDEVGYDKFAILKSKNLIILISLSIGIHFIITYFFFKIINIVSSKKTNYLDITSLYLQGAIVNQVLPGLGYLFRYYKLKLNSKINIAIYTTSQTLWSLFSIMAYFFAAFILGFIVINSYFEIIFINFLILIILISFIKFRYKFFHIINQIFYKFKITHSFFDNLRKIKKKLSKNKRYLFLIFIGFIMLLILECFIFNLGLNYFGISISILQSSYIWITSTIIAILVLINFLGMFEIIITLSASAFMPEVNDVLIFAINLKIINLIATFLIIIYCEILRKLLNK